MQFAKPAVLASIPGYYDDYLQLRTPNPGSRTPIVAELSTLAPLLRTGVTGGG
jgi:hypothetical protein